MARIKAPIIGSDAAHDFSNYGLTADELAKYQKPRYCPVCGFDFKVQAAGWCRDSQGKPCLHFQSECSKNPPETS